MISLITGLPGNGKTLFMLWYIKVKAERENREVYYSGINITNKDVLPWTEFKAEDWYKLPKGAIILIDEAQFTFPKAANGAKLPEHYTKLAIHRHSGHDIFVATQHPKLVDNFLRELVGQHFHCVRKFGLERSTIYEWSNCNAAPQSANSQKSSVSLKWAFKKEVYGWYKSAEVHTVKRSIPAKLVLACLFVVSVVAFGYYMLDRYQHRNDIAKQSDSLPQGVPSGSVSAAPGRPGAAGGLVPVDPLEDAKAYLFRETPRVVGLPQTAPKYDELTKPVRVPVPAACIQRGVAGRTEVTCRCWSQQGTPMDVPFNMCVQFAHNGFFQDFEADRARAEASQRVLERIPDTPPADHAPAAGRVSTMLSGEPMGPQRTARTEPVVVAGVIDDGPPNNRATRAARGSGISDM